MVNMDLMEEADLCIIPSVDHGISIIQQVRPFIGGMEYEYLTRHSEKINTVCTIPGIFEPGTRPKLFEEEFCIENKRRLR